MVAVTVAMAAVAYAYFTGLIGGPQQVTPSFSFTADEVTNTIALSQMEKQSNWQDLKIKLIQGTTQITIQDQTGPKTGPMSIGEVTLINGHGLTGAVTVDVIYIQTSTLVFQYTFNNILP